MFSVCPLEAAIVCEVTDDDDDDDDVLGEVWASEALFLGGGVVAEDSSFLLPKLLQKSQNFSNQYKQVLWCSWASKEIIR